MTELVFILDRSGSMNGMEKDTIGGFNSMLQKQKREPGEAVVSTVLFDNTATVLHDRVPLANVSEMTERDYTVGGCTALLDAVGGAIRHIGNIHKYARKEDIPEKTLVVIITDGLENASRRYSHEDVAAMIKRQQEKYKWEFIFLGANIDAAEEARRYNIDAEYAVDFVCDDVGLSMSYEDLAGAIHEVRSSKRLSTAWRKRIDQDFAVRGRAKPSSIAPTTKRRNRKQSPKNP